MCAEIKFSELYGDALDVAEAQGFGPFPCRVWDHPSDETKSLGYVLTDEVMRSSDYSNFRARADHALRCSAWDMLRQEHTG